MHAVEQLIDRGQHLIDMSLLNQVGRRAILQQALTRKQPQPRIVRLVEIGTGCLDAERTLLLLAWLCARRQGRELV